MVKYILLATLLFSTHLSADYSTYQEIQQNKKVKSLYSKAREIAIDLEHRLNQKIKENEQLKKDIKELKKKNSKLRKKLKKYTKSVDINDSENGEEK